MGRLVQTDVQISIAFSASAPLRLCDLLVKISKHLIKHYGRKHSGYLGPWAGKCVSMTLCFQSLYTHSQLWLTFERDVPLVVVQAARLTFVCFHHTSSRRTGQRGYFSKQQVFSIKAEKSLERRGKTIHYVWRSVKATAARKASERMDITQTFRLPRAAWRIRYRWIPMDSPITMYIFWYCGYRLGLTACALQCDSYEWDTFGLQPGVPINGQVLNLGSFEVQTEKSV